MENLSVIALRGLAREAMLASGARGFMRFAREGNALLVTDAAVRCADGGAALRDALCRAGFVCRSEGALTYVTPCDGLLEQLCEGEGEAVIDWNSPLHPAQALAVRLMREAHAPLDDAGRQLVFCAARALWQPQEKVLAALSDVRALAAIHMREGNRNGFYQAGRLLCNWCQEQTKGEDAR